MSIDLPKAYVGQSVDSTHRDVRLHTSDVDTFPPPPENPPDAVSWLMLTAPDTVRGGGDGLGWGGRGGGLGWRTKERGGALTFNIA